MARISLKSILLMCVYFAVCCLVYVIANLWIGWMVVWATAILMAYATIRAFQTRNHFSLGFAIAGFTWLIVWFGFAIETKTPLTGWSVGPTIANAMDFGRERPKYDASATTNIYAHLHDLYTSGPMAIQTAEPVAPLYHNSVRLFVCLSSLIFGLLGGSVFYFRMKIIGSESVTNPTGTNQHAEIA